MSQGSLHVHRKWWQYLWSFYKQDFVVVTSSFNPRFYGFFPQVYPLWCSPYVRYFSVPYLSRIVLIIQKLHYFKLSVCILFEVDYFRLLLRTSNSQAVWTSFEQGWDWIKRIAWFIFTHLAYMTAHVTAIKRESKSSGTNKGFQIGGTLISLSPLQWTITLRYFDCFTLASIISHPLILHKMARRTRPQLFCISFNSIIIFDTLSY